MSDDRANVDRNDGKPGRRGFDYSLDFDATDFRAHPELYRVGKGEQGVLLVEPYKSELLPHWRFRSPEIARDSSARLLEMFETYKSAGDFVGMDMARKFLQMGYTRSRRYANHRSGQKYAGPVPREHKGESGAWGRPPLPHDPDPKKPNRRACSARNGILSKRTPNIAACGTSTGRATADPVFDCV